jgi:hypothetical protein
MPQHVRNGAVPMCSVGLTPSQLTVLPVDSVVTSSQPATNGRFCRRRSNGSPESGSHRLNRSIL